MFLLEKNVKFKKGEVAFHGMEIRLEAANVAEGKKGKIGVVFKTSLL